MLNACADYRCSCHLVVYFFYIEASSEPGTDNQCMNFWKLRSPNTPRYILIEMYHVRRPERWLGLQLSAFDSRHEMRLTSADESLKPFYSLVGGIRLARNQTLHKQSPYDSWWLEIKSCGSPRSRYARKSLCPTNRSDCSAVGYQQGDQYMNRLTWCKYATLRLLQWQLYDQYYVEWFILDVIFGGWSMQYLITESNLLSCWLVAVTTRISTHPP